MKLLLSLCAILSALALAAPARAADVPPLKEFQAKWAQAGPDVQRKLDAIEWVTSREQSDGVVKALVAIGTSDAEDSQVIESAVKHLADFDGNSAGEPYLEAQLEKAKAWPERAILARAIGRRKNPAAILPLKKALDDKQWEVVAAAIEGLSRQREKDTIEALLSAFEKDDAAKDDGARRLSGDYKDALAKLTGEHCGNAQDWRNWWAAKKDDFHFPSADAATAVEQEGITGERQPRLFTEVNSRRVCFIIDTSFSMSIWTGAAKDKDNPLGLTRFQCMQKEAHRVIEEMPVGSKFNVIAFDTAVKPMGPKMVVASDATRKGALKFLDGLKAAGETNSYGALEAAFADKDVDTIYFLSDGFPTNGKYVDFSKICSEVAKWNTTRFVKIHTIAFVAGDGKKLGVIEGDKGMPKAFMQKLAEDNGGHYRVVE